MDVNNDGVLSRKEIVHFVREFLGCPIDVLAKSVNDIWYKYDTDRN